MLCRQHPPTRHPKISTAASLGGVADSSIVKISRSGWSTSLQKPRSPLEPHDLLRRRWTVCLVISSFAPFWDSQRYQQSEGFSLELRLLDYLYWIEELLFTGVVFRTVFFSNVPETCLHLIPSSGIQVPSWGTAPKGSHHRHHHFIKLRRLKHACPHLSKMNQMKRLWNALGLDAPESPGATHLPL
jgi:hypothetical protein